MLSRVYSKVLSKGKYRSYILSAVYKRDREEMVQERYSPCHWKAAYVKILTTEYFTGRPWDSTITPCSSSLLSRVE